ncbi:hypothetical protein ZOSMA_61G00280 [Zostera marina]|uniref:Dirigent protein n=1 Tax=Zostera marina TaxID=29655 RepID=A0A0K9NVN7_ZOSMR|nr:hypothetical protein ZOSMA_61G00280 [Zostera marina]
MGNSLFTEVGELPTLQRSKVYNFKVYWHESFIPPNASSIVIGGADLSQIDPRGFGTAYAFDCPLTIKPKVPTSPDDVIGNAQGYYILSAREEVGLAVTMNMHFKGDSEKKNVLSFQGRVQSSGNIREVPIIGGSGKFRGATGYYKSRMVSSDPKTHQNIVVFNVMMKIPSKTKINPLFESI